MPNNQDNEMTSITLDQQQFKKLKAELKQELKPELEKLIKQEAGTYEGGKTPEENVINWLNKQGFPLEMEVAAIARDIGFDVAQSTCFIDPEEDGPREIDLVLSTSDFGDGEESDAYINYSLCVECKSSIPSRPWLLFTTPRNEGDEEFLRIEYAYSTLICSAYARTLATQDVIRGTGDKIFPRLDPQQGVSYGLTQAFADAKNDAPFTAMMSSTKAAMAQVHSWTDDDSIAPFVFAFPVIVIDVPLYEVSFSEASNSVELKRVSTGSLNWSRKIADRAHQGVFIVTKEALPDFFRKCKASADWLLSLSQQEIFSIVLDHNERQERLATYRNTQP